MVEHLVACASHCVQSLLLQREKERKRKIPLKNIPLWQNFSELKAIKKQQTQEKLSPLSLSA